jgi:hypothetical protein
MVTALLETAEQRIAEHAAAANGAPPCLTPRDENLIAEVMARFGMLCEQTIEDLILNGGL